jgi:hypothetical protein
MASTSSSTRQTTSTPQSLCLDAPAIGHRNGYLRLSHWNHARPGDDVVMHPLAIWSQLRCMSLTGMGLVGIVQGLAAGTTAEEVVIDFEQVPTRLDPQNDELVNRLERYEEKRVEFKLARARTEQSPADELCSFRTLLRVAKEFSTRWRANKRYSSRCDFLKAPGP